MFPSKSPQPGLVGPLTGRALIGADYRLAQAAVFLCAHLAQERMASMASATTHKKRKASKKLPKLHIESLTDDEKRELGNALTDLLDDHCQIRFHPNGEFAKDIFDFDDEDIGIGHYWQITIPEIEGENDMHSWCQDDKGMDLRTAIAISMRKRAKVLSRWAERLEKHMRSSWRPSKKEETANAS
jgi:hypothetical protein